VLVVGAETDEAEGAEVEAEAEGLDEL